MPTKKGILKPHEELRMKREVEALRNKSKMEYQQMKAKQLEEKIHPLAFLSDSCHPKESTHGQACETSGPAEGSQSNPRDPETLKTPHSMALRMDNLPSPPSSALFEVKPLHPQAYECYMHHSPTDEDLRASTALPVIPPHDSPVPFKSAIAPLAGTTKAVPLSQRPQPVTKARSERRPSAQYVRKPKILKQKAEDPKTKVGERRVTRRYYNVVVSSEESSESNSSEDSGSDHSGRTQHKTRKVLKIKQKTSRPVRQAPLLTSIKTKPVLKANTSMGPRTTAPHVVRSTMELLQEARTIAGVKAEGQEEAGGTAGAPVAKTVVRTSRRTVDEIITSLQGETSVGSSDQIIKDLMKQVLGEGFFADTEEEPQRDAAEEIVIPRPQEPKVPSRKEMQPLTSTTMAHHLMPKKSLREQPMPRPTAIYKLDSEQSVQSDSPKLTEVKQDSLEAIGQPVPRTEKPLKIQVVQTHIQGLAHLATWSPKLHTEEYKTIHHLCTTPANRVLPVELELVSRVCHTTNVVPNALQQRAALPSKSTQQETLRYISEGVEREWLQDTAAEDQEDCVTHLSPENRLALEDWKRIAEYYVEKPRILMQGISAPFCEREMNMFWNPAPPKFGCAPTLLRDKLFPRYQVAGTEELLSEMEESTSGSYKSTDHNSTVTENVLCQKFKSMIDLRAEDSDDSTTDEFSTVKVTRPSSAPLLSECIDPSLRIKTDYRSITCELEVVRKFRQSLPTRDALQRQQQQQQGLGVSKDPPSTHKQPSTKTSQATDAHQTSETEGSAAARQHAHHPQQQRKRSVKVEAAPVQEQEQERTTPKNSSAVTTSNNSRRRAVRSKRLQPDKLASILRSLKAKPRTLARSESVSRLSQKTVCFTQRERSSLLRWPSLPMLLDFPAFASQHGGISPDEVEREWVRDIWEVWFDEVFPPLDESISVVIADPQNGSMVDAEWTESPERNTQELEVVDLSQALGEGLTVPDLEEEVEALTQIMAQQDQPSAFHLCRRGGLYKKLGLLSQAMDDLNKAISMEPGLLNAYWHRHNIHLLRNDHTSALEDLDYIIKHGKKPADAFRSRAEICRARGQATLAILNYTHAIKCSPDNDENYFRRAQMYMSTGEIVLALDDYAKTYTINPKRTDALMIHGEHYYQNANWHVSLADFTAVLKQEPGHALARTYRGQIHAKLGHFHCAVEDFSLAVHLKPLDWKAFYHRGCLLRKREPEVALRDLSTSVLINDGKENFSAFLHRGLIYCDLKQWKQAVADFEAVVKLDSSIAVAHVNLGLIYMLKMDQHYEAIQMFSNGLKVNPTYIRAYICRAKAFHVVGNLKSALKDLVSASHMRPDMHQLYILRGQYLCDMGLFSLATRCVQYAADMNQALGSSQLQQAAVYSFLGNNDKAMTCLTNASDESRLPILILLGKTQMKAHLFQDAMESFKKALAQQLEGYSANAREAAQIYHLMGMCHMSQGSLFQACDAFSNAVKIYPEYAEAYHQRGLCRMRLQQVKSVQDLNRALSINPYFFQVYLSRATYYGSRGRYSKAILNCNAAIKVQPSSVRAYLYRGAFKYFLKVFNGAVDDLTTAIKLDKSCAFAYYNRAVCYHQMKEYELALRDYAIVLLLPEQKEISLKVLINRGLLYVELNDHHNALVDFLTASERKPKDPAIHHALGVYHHRLGQLQQSVEAYTEAMRISPFLLDTYVGRGSAYMDYGHTQANKQAQRDFLSALHLNPLCLNARICLAYNFQVFGCFQKAWNQFTIALEISPNSWAAYEGRAVVNLQMGNLYAAFQDICKALRHNPLRDQLLTNRGVISQCMGDTATAMKDYHKAIAVNPNYALAHFNAANLYFFNRQFEKALEYYNRAVELDPEDESAVLNRGITLTLLRRAPEALQDFAVALRLNPHSSHVYLNRANLYCSLRKYRRAERDLTQAIELQPRDALLYKLRADVRGKLGLTQQALEDYGTSLEFQEAQEVKESPRRPSAR